MGGLYILIEALGPISGAHFNPAVILVMMLRGTLPRTHALAYIPVQLLAAVVGAMLAHATFDLPLSQVSTKIRSGQGQWIAEAMATAGLLLVVLRAPASAPGFIAAHLLGAGVGWAISAVISPPPLPDTKAAKDA